jgi:HEPN domain-containing protein
LILEYVTDDEAEKAIRFAQDIITAVHEAHPDIFTF